jgi:ribosome-binding protein aMBF1 (putative translation factor)
MKKPIKLIPFEEMHAKSMKDLEFAKEYHALDAKFALIQQSIDRRIKKEMTQKQLAEKLKTKQSSISRFESGKGSQDHSITFLRKVAHALDCELEIKFVPRKHAA